MSKVKARESELLEDQHQALSREEQNRLLLEVLESAGTDKNSEDLPTPLALNPTESMEDLSGAGPTALDRIPETPPRGSTATPPTGVRLQHKSSVSEGPSSFDKSSLYGFDSPRTAHSGTPPTNSTPSHRKMVERKYTVLSEFVANRQTFYLEKLDASLPSLVELEETLKYQKLERHFEKKYPGVLAMFSVPEAASKNGSGSGSLQVHSRSLSNTHSTSSNASSATNSSVNKSAVAAYAKFIKEKNELMSVLIEQSRKRTMKVIEMAFQRETKEIQKINAKSRLEELSGITKKSSPIEYKRLGDKYVRRGVEENRKLLIIKNKKIDELNENTHLLRLDLNNRTEEALTRAGRMLTRN